MDISLPLSQWSDQYVCHKVDILKHNLLCDQEKIHSGISDSTFQNFVILLKRNSRGTYLSCFCFSSCNFSWDDRILLKCCHLYLRHCSETLIWVFFEYFFRRWLSFVDGLCLFTWASRLVFSLWTFRKSVRSKLRPLPHVLLILKAVWEAL